MSEQLSFQQEADRLSNDDAVVSDVFRYLVSRSGQTITEIALKTGIPDGTLYSLSSRRSSRGDPRTLKKLAEYFGEELSIFCGLNEYSPSPKLSDKERSILDIYNSLTEAAQERLSGYLSDIAANPQNRKKGR